MNELAGTDVLVTGGAGFVGGNLVGSLLRGEPARVVVVDNLLSAERGSLPDDAGLRFIEGSIADDAVLRRLPAGGFDYVFHLATFHGNQNSIHDPIADHDNNLITTLKLLEQAARWTRKPRAFVYAGAGCAVAEKTYGEAAATDEDAPIRIEMDSPYSISKIAGEFYCQYYWRRHGLPAVRARFQNVYGPGEILGAGEWRGTPATVWRNVVPTFIHKALRREALPLEGGGETSRDFIHVDDVVRGLVACAVRGRPGEAYNLASGRECSIAGLARLVNRITGNPAGVELLARRAWDRSGRRFGNPAKAERELQFRASVDLEPGLRSTVEWSRRNAERIESCVRRHRERMSAGTGGARGSGRRETSTGEGAVA